MRRSARTSLLGSQVRSEVVFEPAAAQPSSPHRLRANPLVFRCELALGDRNALASKSATSSEAPQFRLVVSPIEPCQVGFVRHSRCAGDVPERANPATRAQRMHGDRGCLPPSGAPESALSVQALELSALEALPLKLSLSVSRPSARVEFPSPPLPARLQPMGPPVEVCAPRRPLLLSLPLPSPPQLGAG